MIIRAMLRNAFQWMLIAGLLLAVRNLTNAPDEVRHSEARLAKLGLTEVSGGQKLSSLAR